MKSTTVLTIVVMFLLTASLYAQPDSLWARTYGGRGAENCKSIVETADGGFALSGGTNSFGAGQNDFWLVRTDADGDSLWSRTFGGREADKCYSVIQTADGGFALAGNTESFGSGGGDFWLVRTDENGDSLWSRTFGGEGTDFCNSLIQTTDGGFALAGYTRSFGEGSNDYWLVRTNQEGGELWSQTYGGGGNDYGYSIIQTTDGGFALAGWTVSFGEGKTDSWLVRTDEDGDSLWSQTYGGDSHDYCYSFIQTADGGFALVGETWDEDRSDFWLVRTDDEGELLWSQTYGGEDNEYCYSAIQTADGGYALAGYTESFDEGDDFYLVRTDADGDSLWSRTFGGRNFDHAKSLIQTTDGGFALAGNTTSFGAGESDFWLVKTGPDPVSVPESDFILHPSSFILSSYPNPFNSSATIRFALPTPGMVSVTLVDPLGRRVQEMTPSSWFEAGWHRLSLDAAHLPAGKYFVVLHTGEDVLETPVTVVK